MFFYVGLLLSMLFFFLLLFGLVSFLAFAVLSFLWGLYISICLKYISTNCVFCVKLKKLVKANGNKFHIIKV